MLKVCWGRKLQRAFSDVSCVALYAEGRRKTKNLTINRRLLILRSHGRLLKFEWDDTCECIDNTLSVEDIKPAPMMTLKLDVLPQLMQIHKHAKMIGPFDGGKVALYTEKVIGTVKACMGFTYDEDELVFVPNTVLKEDIRSVSNETSQVVAVYSKRFDSERYDTLCYIADKSDIGKKSPQFLIWPAEIQDKIVPSGIQSLC